MRSADALEAYAARLARTSGARERVAALWSEYGALSGAANARRGDPPEIDEHFGPALSPLPRASRVLRQYQGYVLVEETWPPAIPLAVQASAEFWHGGNTSTSVHPISGVGFCVLVLPPPDGRDSWGLEDRVVEAFTEEGEPLGMAFLAQGSWTTRWSSLSEVRRHLEPLHARHWRSEALASLHPGDHEAQRCGFCLHRGQAMFDGPADGRWHVLRWQ